MCASRQYTAAKRAASTALRVEIVPELATAGRVSQLAERLRLDLPNALARDVELLADLFEGSAAAVLEPEAQAQHLAFTLGKGVEHVLHGLAQHLVGGSIRRGLSELVRDEVTEIAILFLANWRFERNRRLRDFHDLADLVRRQIHLETNLVGGGLAAALLEQAP